MAKMNYQKASWTKRHADNLRSFEESKLHRKAVRRARSNLKPLAPSQNPLKLIPRNKFYQVSEDRENG
jgi:hypothetical protein